MHTMAEMAKAGSSKGKNEVTGRLSRPKVPSWSWAASRVKRKRDFLLVDRHGDRTVTDEVICLAHVVGFTCPSSSTARYTGARADEKEERITLTLKSGVKRGEVVARDREETSSNVKELGVQIMNINDDEISSSSSFVRVEWDYGAGVGDPVVVLSLVKMINSNRRRCHCGLILLQEEGIQDKDGQLCYRRVGFFRYDYRSWGMGSDKQWEEETICLC